MSLDVQRPPDLPIRHGYHITHHYHRQQQQQQHYAPNAHAAASKVAPALNAAAKALLGAHIQQIKGLHSTDKDDLLHLINKLATLDSSFDLAAAAAAAATLDHNARPVQGGQEMQQQQHPAQLATHESSSTPFDLQLPGNATVNAPVTTRMHDNAAAAAAAPAAAVSDQSACTRFFTPLQNPDSPSGCSEVTVNTQTLAASLGARSSSTAAAAAAAGSSLGSSGVVGRSSRSSVAEAMLSEAANAQAGLPANDILRSQSLPDLLLRGRSAAAVGGAHMVQAVPGSSRDFDMLSLNLEDLALPLSQIHGMTSHSALGQQQQQQQLSDLDLMTTNAPLQVATLLPAATAAAQTYALPPRPYNASLAQPARLRLPTLLPPSDVFGAAADQCKQQQWQQQQPAAAAAAAVSSIPLDDTAFMQLAKTAFECDHNMAADIPPPGFTVMHLDVTDNLLQQISEDILGDSSEWQQTTPRIDSMHCTGDVSAMHALPLSAAAAAATQVDGSCIDDNALCNASSGLSAANASASASAAADQAAQGDQLLWQQATNAGGGTTTATTAAATAALVDDSTGMEVDLVETAAAHCPPAAAAAAAQSDSRSNAREEVVRYARVITCRTYLKRMNITQAMAENLLPLRNIHGPCSPQSAAAGCDALDSSGSAGKNSSCYELLFRDVVTLIDESDMKFKVQYEGVMCNNQKHLRFTSGWRDYVRKQGAQVGDTLVLERRGNDRNTLYVSVIKDGDSLKVSHAYDDQPHAAESSFLPNKRRKLTRRQAVQRLE